MKLEGKTAIITAAGAGIGRASTLLFASEGARILAADINPKTGRETVDLVRAAGGAADFLQVDVSDTMAVKTLVAQAIERLGRVDILFNNAGIVPEGDLETATEEEWDYTFAVNVRSIFVACKAIVPHMRNNGGGVIVNTASIAGSRGLPDRCIYCTTKAAVINFTRYMAREYAKDNIRANCVSPGTVDTPSLQERLANAPDPEAKRKFFVARQPLGRFATAEEIARGALYLATEPFVTGTNLLIDGGFTA